jgi:hypothetical protein
VLVDVVPAGAPILDMRAVLRAARILQRRGDNDIIVVGNTDYTVTDVVRFDVKDRKGRHLYSEARILFGWQERKGRSNKTHRPVTLWRQPDERLEWRAKGYRKPGPLYGLETLDSDPDAAVVVYEGPGKSDRARELAPGRIHLSLMGGAKKVDHTDVSDLKGRDVVLWSAYGRGRGDRRIYPCFRKSRPVSGKVTRAGFGQGPSGFFQIQVKAKGRAPRREGVPSDVIGQGQIRVFLADVGDQGKSSGRIHLAASLRARWTTRRLFP